MHFRAGIVCVTLFLSLFVLGVTPVKGAACVYYRVLLSGGKVCQPGFTEDQCKRCNPAEGKGCSLARADHPLIPGATYGCSETGVQSQPIQNAEECSALCKVPISGSIDGFTGKANIKCTFLENDNSCNVWSERTGIRVGEPAVGGFSTVESNKDKSGGGNNIGSGNPETGLPVQTEQSSILPPCALEGTCRNINNLLEVVINAGEWVFGIIGSIAFAVFVYGGFTVVTSFGNSEKVKKGYQILGSALIGMAIAFGAYLMVNFILDALQVDINFRAIK